MVSPPHRRQAGETCTTEAFMTAAGSVVTGHTLTIAVRAGQRIVRDA